MTRCPTCHQEQKLTDPQRDRYQAMLGNLLAHPKLQHLTRKQLHLYFKDKFLGGEDVVLPNGKIIYELKSVSRKKGVGKLTMSEYMDKINAWCSEVGVWEVEE